MHDPQQAVDSPYMRERGLVRRDPQTGTYEAAFPVRIDGSAPSLRPPLVEGEGTA